LGRNSSTCSRYQRPETGGKKAPTLEDIGRLYVFLRTFESDFREIEGYLRAIRESLFDLDFVRIQENVNPDAAEGSTA
jgi:hypothetical protein